MCLVLLNGFLGKLREFFETKAKFLSHIYLLLVVVIGWVFFYYTDLSKAFTVLGRMVGIGGSFKLDTLDASHLMNYIFFIIAAVIACLPVAPKLRSALSRRESRIFAPGVLAVSELVVCVVLLIVCTAMLVGESYNPFLYFRF